MATDEDPTASPEECLRRFGQADHVRWYGDDVDERFSQAGLATLRVTPPALLGEAAVEWFHLMPHEVVWIARPGEGAASPMTACGTSGLSAAFDAVLGELAHTREQLESRPCAWRPAGPRTRRAARPARPGAGPARAHGPHPTSARGPPLIGLAPWVPWVNGSI